MKSILSGFLAVVLCISTVACDAPKTSDLVTALNAVSDAASVSVVITSSLVALGQIDQSVADQVAVYSAGVGAAVNTAIVELNSANPNPQKIATITAAFAKVATPAFGGKAPQIAATIDAVTGTIKLFLSHLNSSGLLAAANANPNVPIKLTSGDKKALKLIQQKTVDTAVKAKKLTF